LVSRIVINEPVKNTKGMEVPKQDFQFTETAVYETEGYVMHRHTGSQPASIHERVS
jgi:hypothetical protein